MKKNSRLVGMANKRLINLYKGDKRVYEVSVILNHTLSAETLNAKIESLKNITKELGAEISYSNVTGLKSYCYPIHAKNNKKGYYACLYINAKPESISEILRKFSVQDDVLRTLIILSNPKKQGHGIFGTNYEEENVKTKGKHASYDDPNFLLKFLGERGKIEPRKQVFGKKTPHGLAVKQRNLSKQIKRSRFLSLLPYVEE